MKRLPTGNQMQSVDLTRLSNKSNLDGSQALELRAYIGFRHIVTYFELNERKTLLVLRMKNYGKRIWKETNSLRA